MKLRALALAVPLAIGWPHVAHACEGCVVAAPKSIDAGPSPLLVVLHGDYGVTPVQLAKAWERHASPRGVTVLAVKCPPSLGCEGSFWKWNHEPAWLFTAVDEIATSPAIDPDRVWLAGWSGGASYIGLRTQALEERFAAIVVHGGGIAPQTEGCSVAKPPIYFLVGDANPLHALARGLRDHYASCGNELVWNVKPRADHAAEWKALDANGAAVLDWLADKHRAKPPSPNMENARIDPSAPAPATVPSRPSACGCTTPGRSPLAADASILLACATALLACVARSRTPKRRPRRELRRRASSRAE